MKICSVPGCGKNSIARTLCKGHYQAAFKKGFKDAPPCLPRDHGLVFRFSFALTRRAYHLAYNNAKSQDIPVGKVISNALEQVYQDQEWDFSLKHPNAALDRSNG